MKNSVNLYAALPKKVRVKLSFVDMGLINLLLIGLLVIVYGMSYFQERGLTSELVTLQSEQSTLQSRMIVMGKELGDAQGLQNISKEQIAALEEEVQFRKRVLSVLGQQSFSNTKGFSNYLTDLGKNIVSNVWLKKISLKQGGDYLSFQGQAFLTHDVLAFMKNLHTDDLFATRNLKLSEMVKSDEKAKDRVVDFVLHTSQDV